MADLNNDVRLAVDTGKVSFGNREVMRAINAGTVKVVVVAAKGKKPLVEDINHVCKVGGVKLITFKGSSLELGTVCGKPYSVNSLAIMDEGNSTIMKEEY